MKYIYLTFLLVIIVIAIKGFSGKSTDSSATSNNQGDKMQDLKFPGVLPKEQIDGKVAVIETEKGTIEFTFFPDRAPKTVSNFVYLSQKGFYDGLTFHRVVPGFVIQGGDPKGDGSGGPGYQFEDETVQGDYKAGAVAMANSGLNTNGSQFFICLEDQPTLPKSYNLFGQVTLGMDVVKKIQVGDKIKKITIK